MTCQNLLSYKSDKHRKVGTVVRIIISVIECYIYIYPTSKKGVVRGGTDWHLFGLFYTSQLIESKTETC